MNSNINKQAHGKVIVMILFLIMDLGLNSTLDYDVLNDERADNILLGVFGLQVVVQISVCLILFLAAADTYLFRVGLLGILIRTISIVLVFHPLYMALTIAVGAYRVRHLSGTGSLTSLWKDDTFITISFIQKLCEGKPYVHASAYITRSHISIYYGMLSSFSGSSILHCQYSCDHQAGRPYVLQQDCLDQPHKTGNKVSLSFVNIL